ncbi:MAG: hypothetical protein FJ247_10000 [Nitrospira sp.]|nr:hypothetical protein [Nitrospira sp.]
MAQLVGGKDARTTHFLRVERRVAACEVVSSSLPPVATHDGPKFIGVEPETRSVGCWKHTAVRHGAV